MGKYANLGNSLKNKSELTVRYTFTEIKELLGFNLPSSAKKYRPWWANDRTHSHARDGWLNVGWEVRSVDLTQEWVVFQRISVIKSDLTNLGKNRIESETAQKTKITARDFEEIAKEVISNYFGVELSPRKRETWPKLFDLVSEDFSIIGDVKYYSMVQGRSLPSAKFSTIAEHVWFLEKLPASIKFLVFGNDIEVPE